MEPEFWQQRWRDNRIGFHNDKPLPLLLKHWPSLGLAPGTQVFVPLAGKSLDMAWLASQGHRVLGVELSPLAVEQFFEEHELKPEQRKTRYGTHFEAGGIEIVLGNAFGLDAEALAGCAGVYDRAALIALPPDLRARYVGELYAQLPQDCRGLLVTLEYPPHEKQGPPFSVTEAEVMERYGRDWEVEVLERRDILAQQPGFQAEGVSALQTEIYKLVRR